LLELKQTVIAIIEKIPLKLRNTVSEITLDMAANMGLIAKNVSLTQLASQIDSMCKISIRGLQEIRKIPLASH
jgi:hypothetical protein